ncbi:MAG: nitrogen fixation protein [Cyanobium sp.]
MSWCELERLVQEAESRPPVRRALRGCADDADLLLRARRLGYRITRVDLQRAWLEHQQHLQRSAEARKARRASC